jgi:hypothetical protein
MGVELAVACCQLELDIKFRETLGVEQRFR